MCLCALAIKSGLMHLAATQSSAKKLTTCPLPPVSSFPRLLGRASLHRVLRELRHHQARTWKMIPSSVPVTRRVAVGVVSSPDQWSFHRAPPTGLLRTSRDFSDQATSCSDDLTDGRSDTPLKTSIHQTQVHHSYKSSGTSISIIFDFTRVHDMLLSLLCFHFR